MAPRVHTLAIRCTLVLTAALWLGQGSVASCAEPEPGPTGAITGSTLPNAQTDRGQDPVRDAAVEIGWCAFYPAVDVGMDRLPDSNATVLSVCAGGWSMAPAQGVYDFTSLDRQIDYAEQHGLKLALINEVNPLYTPSWLRRLVTDAGEAVCGPNGAPGAIPSITSPLFAKEQRSLVERTIEHVKQRDRTGVVRYYHPGAEWWFPLGERYSGADVAAFREWLRGRYATIDRLNETWQTQLPSFDAVPPPRLEMAGGGRGRPGLADVYLLPPDAQHASWSTATATDPAAQPGPTTFAEITAGKPYTATAWVKLSELRGCGALIEIAWVGPRGGAPMAIDDGPPVRGSSDWQQISVSATAPRGAARAWILLKVLGTGTATFDDVALCESGTTANLAPNPQLEEGDVQPSGWSFQNWGGGTTIRAERLATAGRGGSHGLQIVADHGTAANVPDGNSDAAIHDWSSYWYEAAGRYVNSLSQQVKQLDPSRRTVTYLTMSWAYPSEWDESQRSAIAPEVVAQQGTAIDEFGLQLCAADGDPYRITACLDLVRKYGKPMWAVDLVDFTSGVQIGYPALDRATQSAIQHGASGIIYCAWHIPTVLDYSFYPNVRGEAIQRMIQDARTTAQLLAGMQIQSAGALVQPILPAGPHDAHGFKNDYRSFVGWYKLLERLGQTVDVVSLQELDSGAVTLDGAERYPWIVVPDCAYLSDAACTRLAHYASAGGMVISTERFGQFDAVGRPRTRSDSLPTRRTVPDLGRSYAGDPIRDTHAGNTPPLFLWKSDSPESDRAFLRAKELLGPTLARTDPSRSFEILEANTEIRIAQRRGAERVALCLVHAGGNEAARARVRLHADGAPRITVYIDAQRTECSCQTGDAGVDITLPVFHSHCIVLADLKDGPDTGTRSASD